MKEKAEKVKLNLGGGEVEIPGYVNIDRKNGQEAYPLEYADESVDEIRASHLLEHFPHSKSVEVVREWARVLKPGGILKVAVPNFDYIIENYVQPKQGVPVVFNPHAERK